MLIFSFDAGIKRLGVCVLYVANGAERDALDDQLRAKRGELSVISAHLAGLASDLWHAGDYAVLGVQMAALADWLVKLKLIAGQIDALLSQYIHVRYLNTVHLIHHSRLVKSVPRKEWIDRLNYTLACLGAQFGMPDIVLIERQMTISENINGVSKFIEKHYRPAIECEFTELNSVYKLTRCKLPTVSYPQILIVNPIVKNTLDLNKKKSYGDFAEKLGNTAANKNHTNTNLQYWFDTWKIPLQTTGKTYDSADAFMMAMAMLYRGTLQPG